MICVFLAKGFEEIEAITPIDVLRRANLDVKTIGIGGKIIEGTHGIKIEADLEIENLNINDIDGIILPGGMPGTTNLSKNEKLKDIILKCNEKKQMIAAICAAPSILGEMGILKDKKACCYPGFEDKLLGANISSEEVCVSENIITSKGPGTALNFSLKIVEYICGKEIKEKVRKSMQCGNI